MGSSDVANSTASSTTSLDCCSASWAIHWGAFSLPIGATQMRRSTASRAFASRTAQSTAKRDCSEPSTPTTINLSLQKTVVAWQRPFTIAPSREPVCG